jgi:hypothetical protein
MRTRKGKDATPFEERLAEVAEQAKARPPGIKRDALMRKVRQAETTARLNEWRLPAYSRPRRPSKDGPWQEAG